MRKVLLTMIILLTSYATIFAQGIEIAFALSVGNCQLSDNTAKMLRSKFLPAMTESGVETAEVSTIAIKPEISFVNKQVVEGGMRNIHTSDIQFNFVCTNLATSTTFASCVVTVRGEGFSDDDAIKNAISKLSAQDKRLTDFVNKSKDKIIDYYQHNLNSVISRARTFANIQQYGEGLALLFSCPATISGYTKVNNEITTIYRQYQTQECNNVIQKARAEFSNGNFDAAVEYLQQIDMTSSCATEAKQLCTQIKQTKDAEARRAVELIERQSQRETDLEKTRIKAARDVAVAYCKRRSDVYFVW